MTTTAPAHKGCRVCGRTDVGLLRDGALRKHVTPGSKGSSFLLPGSGRCDGTGHPPRGVVGPRALRITEALRGYFRDLEDRVVFEAVAEAVQQQLTHPDDAFEVMLDMPSCNWRLRKGGREDQAPIRLACYRFPDQREGDEEKVREVNALLAKL